MEKDLKIDSENKEKPNPLNIFGTIVICGALGVLTFFAGSSPISVISVILAASLGIYIFTVKKRFVLPLFACIAAGAAVIYYTHSKTAGLSAALTVLLTSAAGAACVNKKIGLVKSAAVTGAVFFAVSAVFFEYTVYRAYGSIINGTGMFFSQMFDTLAESMKKTLDSVQTSGVSMSYKEIRAMISETAMLFPGFFAVSAEIVGALVYIGSYLTALATGKDVKKFYPELLRISVGPECAVFFIISSIVSSLFMFSDDGYVVYAFLNLSVILALPMIAAGIYIMVMKMRRPKIVIKDENGIEYRPLTFSAFYILIPLIFINFVMALIFSACYGAVNIIMADRAKKKAEKNKDGKVG